MRGMLAGPTVGVDPRVRPPVSDVAGGQPFAPVGAGLIVGQLITRAFHQLPKAVSPGFQSCGVRILQIRVAQDDRAGKGPVYACIDPLRGVSTRPQVVEHGAPAIMLREHRMRSELVGAAWFETRPPPCGAGSQETPPSFPRRACPVLDTGPESRGADGQGDPPLPPFGGKIEMGALPPLP